MGLDFQTPFINNNNIILSLQKYVFVVFSPQFPFMKAVRMRFHFKSFHCPQSGKLTDCLVFSGHSTLSVENQQLRQERDNLSEKLASTKDTLKDALEKLSRANQRKESVERAICKQLTKTHHVLKKAKGNLKQANSLPQ